MFSALKASFLSLVGCGSSHVRNESESLSAVAAPTLSPSPDDIAKSLTSDRIAGEVAVLLRDVAAPIDRYDIVMQFPYGERQLVFSSIYSLSEQGAVKMSGCAYGVRTLILTDKGRQATTLFLEERPENSSLTVSERKQREFQETAISLGILEKQILLFMHNQTPTGTEARHDISSHHNRVPIQDIIKFLAGSSVSTVADLSNVMGSLIEKGLISELSELTANAKAALAASQMSCSAEQLSHYYREREVVAYVITAFGDRLVTQDFSSSH